MTRGLGQGAVLPPTSQATVDKTRILRQALFRPEPQTLHDTGTVALDQGIGLAQQIQSQGDPFRLLEVDDYPMLPALEDFEIDVPTQLLCEGDAPLTGNHCNFGAHVGQDHPRQRPRPYPFKLYDFQPG
ncbi:hypothetical protein D3C87_1427490 [compost metagenome]